VRSLPKKTAKFIYKKRRRSKNDLSARMDRLALARSLRFQKNKAIQQRHDEETDDDEEGVEGNVDEEADDNDTPPNLTAASSTVASNYNGKTKTVLRSRQTLKNPLKRFGDDFIFDYKMERGKKLPYTLKQCKVEEEDSEFEKKLSEVTMFWLHLYMCSGFFYF